MTPPGGSLEDQLHRVGPSLRVRALLVLTAVSVAPLVVASVASERSSRDPEVARTTLVVEARSLARQLEHDAPAEAAARLHAAQARDGGRYRLVDRSGAVLDTVGSSHRPDFVEQVQAFVFGDDQLPPAPPISHLREAPILADSFALARARGEHADCRPAAEGRYLSCHAIAACGPRFLVATDLLLSYATSVFAGTLVMAVLAPLVAVYYHTSTWAGPLLGLGSALLGVTAGVWVFVRVSLRAVTAERGRGGVLFAIAVLTAVKLAMMLQLIAIMSPILPQADAFDGGIDALVSR